MSEVREPIPKTLKNKHFPIGDADLTIAANKLKDVYELEELRGVEGAMLNYILEKNLSARYEVGSWYKAEGGKEQLTALMIDWGCTLRGVPTQIDLDDHVGNRMASIGIFGLNTSVSIGRKGLLPPVSIDCTDELINLAGLDRQGINSFAVESWSTMHESHPNIYGVLSPWAQAFSEAVGPLNEDELLMAEAAIALPYQMSAFSRSSQYLEAWYDSEAPVPMGEEGE